MKKIFQHPFYIFLIAMLSISAILFLLPISLFKGEFVIEQGTEEIVTPAVFSLSYFIGMYTKPSDFIDVKDFYLLPEGKMLAVIFILGIPALLGYRAYLKKERS